MTSQSRHAAIVAGSRSRTAAASPSGASDTTGSSQSKMSRMSWMSASVGRPSWAASATSTSARGAVEPAAAGGSARLPVSTGSRVPTRKSLCQSGFVAASPRCTDAFTQPPAPAASSSAAPVRKAVANAGSGNVIAEEACVPNPQPKVRPFAESGPPDRPLQSIIDKAVPRSPQTRSAVARSHAVARAGRGSRRAGPGCATTAGSSRRPRPAVDRRSSLR